MSLRKPIDRRTFLKQSSAAAAAVTLSRWPLAGQKSAPHLRNRKLSNKVIILGMDGMDPKLVRQFIAEGRMPTFKKFIEKSYFGELQTTMPPQSPVAWSSFITGTNPGGHGIFDFIHRDPSDLGPYLSTSRSFAPEHQLRVRNWSIPLSSGEVKAMRGGQPFWSSLEEQDIPTWVFQIPANYPVTSYSARAVSGMGTPDILGGYGTFTVFSELDFPHPERFDGGRIERVRSADHQFKGTLRGPRNPFKSSAEETELPVLINRDPTEQMVRVELGGEQVLLRKGEWSEWIPLRFSFVPGLASVAGMVRLHVQEVHPYFRMYVSPINIDPIDPGSPICSPSGYSKELAENVGRFYTQGLPADTKALSLGALSDEEFLAQAGIVLDENLRALDFELGRFHEGVFFFYFSSLDQTSHMMWRTMDPSHPLYDEKASPEVKGAIRNFYDRMDWALARTLREVDESTTFLLLSDHGFNTFTREFHLNTWLAQNGYLKLTNPKKALEGDYFQYVDWSKPKAYGLGINGLYLNLRGREQNGVVEQREVAALKAELSSKLPKVLDPLNGNQIVLNAYDSEKIYSGPFTHLAPEILLGYAHSYRSSDETVLGRFTTDYVGDRTNKWAGDHCIDPSVVPGVLFSNKPCKATSPGIWDLAPTILSCFGIEAPNEMTGTPLLTA